MVAETPAAHRPAHDPGRPAGPAAAGRDGRLPAGRRAAAWSARSARSAWSTTSCAATGWWRWSPSATTRRSSPAGRPLPDRDGGVDPPARCAAPDGTLRLVVQGLERIRLVEFTATEPYLVARVEPCAGPMRRPASRREGLRRAVVDLFRRLVAADRRAARTSWSPRPRPSTDPRQLAYLVASTIPLPRRGAPGAARAGPGRRQAAPAGRAAPARAGGARAGPARSPPRPRSG